MAGATPEAIGALAQNHLDFLESLSPGAARMIDKLPANFTQLGLIAALFPHARVIHCRRDPRDICLSCYFTDFAAHGMRYSCDLEHIGVVYAQHDRLMAHWAGVLPLDILPVRYEEMVGDQESMTRRLVDFCGLEWDENCLEFHKHNRQVKTASLIQVRQPIYKTSMKKWLPYAEYLAPFLDQLPPDALADWED